MIAREMIGWLPVAILIATLITILADRMQARRIFRVFKPATTIAIIMLAYMHWSGDRLLYCNAILAGLVFSLAGDIFLMLAPRYFIAGLASFLLAHGCYIAAFHSAEPLLTWGVPAGAMCAAIGILLMVTVPRAGKLALPVMVYGGVILGMLLSALARWQVGGPGSTLALCGALLFVASDAVLALNKFVMPLPSAQAWILGSYFPAQMFIAQSSGG